MKLKTLPIFLAFLCMGFGDAVNTFVGVAKSHFSLSAFEASFIASAGFIMFGLLSVPMGIFQDRKGRKTTLLMGLGVALVGILAVMFLGLDRYWVFLLSILLLGAGATILQVSGNPIMRDVSDEGRYSSNLSMGQFVKAIGSFTAPVVFYAAAKMGYTESQSWSVLFPIFAAAIAITIVSVAMLNISERASEARTASVGSCIMLLANPFVAMMVLGIFVYVGAEVCIGSGMPVYFSQQFAIPEAEATKYVMYFFITIMAGRFLGAVMLTKIAPKKFLALTSALAIFGFGVLALGSSAVSSELGLDFLRDWREAITTASLIILALGYANIFPLIFSIAIDRMPSKSNELSGLMVSAICGGAFLFPVMTKIGDAAGDLFYGFSVPLAAMVYILAVALVVNPKGAK